MVFFELVILFPSPRIDRRVQTNYQIIVWYLEKEWWKSIDKMVKNISALMWWESMTIRLLDTIMIISMILFMLRIGWSYTGCLNLFLKTFLACPVLFLFRLFSFSHHHHPFNHRCNKRTSERQQTDLNPFHISHVQLSYHPQGFIRVFFILSVITGDNTHININALIDVNDIHVR